MAKQNPLGWNRDHPFRGSASSLKQSPYLAAADIAGKVIKGLKPGTIAVTISDLRIADKCVFEDNRTKEGVPLLCFAKASKVLVLNATNRKTLTQAYSDNVTWWFGKKILLYVQPGIRRGKEFVDGIRIEVITPPSFPPEGWALPEGWKAGDPIPAVGGAPAQQIDAPLDPGDVDTPDAIEDAPEEEPTTGGMSEPPDEYVSGTDPADPDGSYTGEQQTFEHPEQ